MGLFRIFLALVVVTAHFQVMDTLPNGYTVAPEKFTLGFHSAYAVLFFYVISGFLITFTLTRNYVGRPDGTLIFYKNRAIRIFSLYWPLFLLSLLLIGGAEVDFAGRGVLDKFTSVFLLGSDWNLDFATFPEANWQAIPLGLHPAWTLGAEMSFYLAAPFLARHWRIVVVLLLASLLLRGMLVYHFGTRIVERWTYYFTPATFVFFMLGQGICLLSERQSWLKNHRLGYAAMLGALLTMFFTHDTGFDIRRLWISIGFFTLALPGFFDATKNIRWMNRLGNLSYPIYLTHPMAVALVGPTVFFAFRNHGLTSQAYLMPMILTFLLVSVVIGVAAHVLLEIPISALLHAALSRTVRVFRRSSA